MRRQAGLLLAVIMLDGALLGAFASIANHGDAGGAGSRGQVSAEEVQEQGLAQQHYMAGSRMVRAADGGNAAGPAGQDGGSWQDGDSRQDGGFWQGGDSRQEGNPAQGSHKKQGAAAGQKVVALTFDDGPHKKWTALLLDGLKERDVKATFFLMGENIEGNEDLVRRMKEEGHLIGNHSFRHIQLTKAGEEVVCQAVEDTERLIADITGVRPQYLRPPYGDWNEDLECRMDLTTVLWTLDSLDWKLRDTGRIVRKVEGAVKHGDIILMHDVFPTSVEAALQLVDDLKRDGYAFVTVDELLID